MVLLALSLAAVLGAAPSAVPNGPRLGLGVGTDFPVAAGVHVRSEVGPRIQLGASVGLFPTPYLRTINSALVALDAYGERTADLIEAALDNALVGRFQVGWRPFVTSGFYVNGGYSVFTLGGKLTGTELLRTLTGSTSDSPLLERVSVDTSATLHQAGLELGFRFRPTRQLWIEWALGGFYTLAARSEFQLFEKPELREAFTPLRGPAETYLEDTLERYFHGGYVSVRVYWDLLPPAAVTADQSSRFAQFAVGSHELGPSESRSLKSSP